MSADPLLHLNLFRMSLFLIELGAKAMQVLGGIGLFVGFASNALADALFVIEPKPQVREGEEGLQGWRSNLPCAMLLAPSFNVSVKHERVTFRNITRSYSF